MPLTDEAIDAIASAIFDKPGARVLEAYSAFDQDPLVLTDAASVSDYVKACVAHERGLAYLFVVYPDMGGRAVKRTIQLDPTKVDGHRIRYTWDGWGLIAVQLTQGSSPPAQSRIAANSEARANAWAATFPELDAPSTWDWTAVARHVQRLKRVLRKAVPG